MKNKTQIILVALSVLALILPLIMVTSTLPDVLAQTRAIQTQPFSRNLTFPADGAIDHWYVERINKTRPAYINISHQDSFLILNIETVNVQNLTIDCPSCFNDNRLDVWDTPGTSYWWVEWLPTNDKYIVNLESDGLEKVTWDQFKIEPCGVVVDGTAREWTFDGEDLTAEIEPLTGTNEIEIYFNCSAFRSTYSTPTVLEIYKGWNLIGNPYTTQMTLHELLGANMQYITWISERQESGEFITTTTYNLTLEPLQALYIYSAREFTYTTYGINVPRGGLELQRGWSMISLTQTTNVTTLTNEGAGTIVTRDINGEYHSYKEGFGPKFDLKPGKGYYIYVKEDTTILESII